MISDDKMWDEAAEKLLVQAVHEAIRRRRSQIRKETDGPNAAKLSKATMNRWERFEERLRLALAGAKREDDVRFAFVDLFSRAKTVTVLREADGWSQMLPVVRWDWRLARDLGLLALASFSSRKTDPTSQAPAVTTPEELDS